MLMAPTETMTTTSKAIVPMVAVLPPCPSLVFLVENHQNPPVIFQTVRLFKLDRFSFFSFNLTFNTKKNLAYLLYLT
jgi:hypothetical protein